MRLPYDEQGVQELVSSFYNAHGFPQCIGAVDGTHIPIKEPIDNATDCINRKGFLSINVQATCDYKYGLIHVVEKWPGGVHGTRIFQNSSLNSKLRDGSVSRCYKTIVDDEDPFLSAYQGIQPILYYHI